MTLAVRVFMDHTCPYSFMAFTAARQVTARREIVAGWHLLPIAGDSTGLTPAEAAMHTLRHESDWPAAQAVAKASFGLTLHRPPWGADAGAAAAAARWLEVSVPDAAEAFHAALFEAFFGRGLDIGSPAVLASLLTAAGHDPTGLADALEPWARGRALSGDAAEAARRGITAVPATVVGNHLLLGAQPGDVIERTLDQIMLFGEGSPGLEDRAMGGGT